MPKTLWNFLFVGVAGALGAMLRYGVALLFEWSRPFYPVGTLVINLTGSFILGWLYTFVEGKTPLGVASDQWRIVVGVGFVGAYTTFSTFMFESDKMFQDGAWLRAISYLAASLFLGLLVFRLGVIAGGRS